MWLQADDRSKKEAGETQPWDPVQDSAVTGLLLA